MLLMASSGLGLAQVASHFPHSGLWQFIGQQTEHSNWVGCTLWDIIQPAFMFMVGVALPWSVTNRRARGQTFGNMLGHALWRAGLLVLLAVFLTSAWSERTEWVFTNVLAQIGLGYPFLFLLAFAKPRTQVLAAVGILFGIWLAFALYPLPSALSSWNVGNGAGSLPHLRGFAAHWQKDTNLAAAFDRWFLNLFPRHTAFLSNAGGYQTLSFIPSIATMIFGLMAGQLLRSGLSWITKLERMAVAGLAGIIVGHALGVSGFCPMVKRIWTPSWAIFSAGWVCLLLASFVAIIEWRGWRSWTFPLVVAGLNPIALYCMWQLSAGFVRENLQRHFGPHFFQILGVVLDPVMQRAAVLAIFWLVLLWMYRRKIFIRI